MQSFGCVGLGSARQWAVRAGTTEGSGAEKVPGFAVARIFLAASLGAQVEGAGAASEDGIRDDVPGVERDEIDGEKVDRAGRVGGASGAHDVEAELAGAALVERGFDLDAEEASVMFDGDVVEGGVAVGFGDAESFAGGAGHETELGPLSALFTAGKFIAFHENVLEMKTRPEGPRSMIAISYYLYL